LAAGKINGQGELKCYVDAGDRQRPLVGLLTIGGRIADKKAALQLLSRVAKYSVELPLTAN